MDHRRRHGPDERHNWNKSLRFEPYLRSKQISVWSYELAATLTMREIISTLHIVRGGWLRKGRPATGRIKLGLRGKEVLLANHAQILALFAVVSVLAGESSVANEIN